jgi:ferredoxin
MSHYESCAFCPQLCRHVCPVAVATGREAATPAKLMTAVLLAKRGRIPPEDAARAAALCTGCGACREHCKYGIDVPALLARARAVFAPPYEPAPRLPIQGSSDLVAIQCDDRPWAPALARALGREVASLETSDHLGQAILEHPTRAAAWLSGLQGALAGRRAVSCCSRCIGVLDAARVAWVGLEELTEPRWRGPVFVCHGERTLPGAIIEPAPACCGGHGALERVHPSLVSDLAQAAVAQLPAGPVAAPDTVCRHTLRGAGGDVHDPIDLLLGA